MPLLNYLPLITGIFFIIAVVLIVMRVIGHPIRYALLFIMMTGTGLAMSLIEAIIIYSRGSLDDLFIKEKIILFIAAIIINSISCLLKGVIINKDLSSKGSDYGKTLTKLNAIDPLILIMFILVLVLFK